MCQTAFGNDVAPLAGLSMADLTWTRGAPGRFRSSDAVARGFCRACGTPLFDRADDRGRISVSLGSLDDPDRVLPEAAHGLEGRRAVFDRLRSCPARPAATPTLSSSPG